MSDIIGEVQGNLCSSFQWSISDFLLLSQKSGDCYQSPDFEYGDTTWCLRIYPNGSNLQHFGWISLFLKKQKLERTKRVVTYLLVIKNSAEYMCKMCKMDKSEFGEKGQGWNKFLERDKLIDSLTSDNVLTVWCTIGFEEQSAGKSEQSENKGIYTIQPIGNEKDTQEEVNSEEERDEVHTRRNPKGIDELLNYFEGLLLSKEDSDVTLKVKDREFRAHKFILGARSPVFRSMFKHDVVEASGGVVDIPDGDPDTFQDFLLYLYSVSFKNISTCNAPSLFAAADKYDVQDLRAECLEIMKKEISVDTFCDVVTVALQYSESKLLEICTDFFTKNMKVIIETVQWQSFIKENSIASNELLIKALKSYSLISG